MLSLCKGKSLFCGSTCWSTWRWRVLKSAINWLRNSLRRWLPPPPSGGECDEASVEKHEPVKPYNSALVLELLFGAEAAEHWTQGLAYAELTMCSWALGLTVLMSIQKLRHLTSLNNLCYSLAFLGLCQASLTSEFYTHTVSEPCKLIWSSQVKTKGSNLQAIIHKVMFQFTLYPFMMLTTNQHSRVQDICNIWYGH